MGLISEASKVWVLPLHILKWSRTIENLTVGCDQNHLNYLEDKFSKVLVHVKQNYPTGFLAENNSSGNLMDVDELNMPWGWQ